MTTCLSLAGCMSACFWVSVFLNLSLPGSLDISLSGCLNLYLFGSMYICLCLAICATISARVTYHVSVYLPDCLSFICLLSHSFCLFVCLIVCVSIGVFISQCVYLYVCLFICLPVYLGWHTLSMHRRFWFRSFRACDFNGEVKRWAVINHGVFRDRRFSTNWVCIHVRECVAWWSNG